MAARKDLSIAIDTLAARLALLKPAIVFAETDGVMLSRIGDLERALSATGVALGLARREVALAPLQKPRKHRYAD